MNEADRRLLEKTAADHEKRGWSLTKEIRHACKEKFYNAQIPMLKAKGEADGLLAALNTSGICD